MLSDQALAELLHAIEADNVERTVSIRNTDKIGEAICAFANDLPDRRSPGVLFLGANDDGTCGHLQVTDRLLTTLLDFGRDGRIVPLPPITVRRIVIDGCELAVVEVQPSDNPPVRYDGRVCVRRGPQRGYANPDDERRLSEKRRWGALPFDQQGMRGPTLDDLDLVRFEREYLPSAVSREVLAENRRNLHDQLVTLHLVTPNDLPTPTAVLVLGIEPRRWLPGAYIQFVRYEDTDPTSTIKDQKEIAGPLVDQLRRIDEVLAANIAVATNLTGAKEAQYPDYPLVALQEFVRNAVIHRNFESSNAPTRVVWYRDRIEISSPGGPYGQVTTQNFGAPHVTDYRNPGIAEAAKALGYMQRFGSGIPRAVATLTKNGNPLPEFQPDANYVLVILRPRP